MGILSVRPRPVAFLRAAYGRCRRHPWRLFLPTGRRALRFDSHQTYVVDKRKPASAGFLLG
jgi:hypothetical protein